MNALLPTDCNLILVQILHVTALSLCSKCELLSFFIYWFTH